LTRPLLVVGVVLVVGSVAGVAFEALSESGDGARYPAPGRLIELDGRRVRLDCTGTGPPTVVLEAGLGESGLTWADVQPLVATHARVCSYDRAGYGWSDAVGGSRDAAREAGELQRLLEVAASPGRTSSSATRSARSWSGCSPQTTQPR
jgi:hypothetical protein